MRVIYDGSFEGFLTLIHEYYYKKIYIAEISKSSSNSLFEEHTIITDELKATQVLEGIKKKFSKEHFDTIRNVFLCDTKEFEKALFDFIVLGFKDEKNLKNINHPSIFQIQNLEKEYFRVVHRMKGFVRFEELEDSTLYTKIETKFNTLYYLGVHFVKRLHGLEFIIHDVKRELAFVHSKKQTNILHVSDYEDPIKSKNEEHFQNLWKVFFQSVAIESRKNEKLQQHFVPLIYRTYMSEFN